MAEGEEELASLQEELKLAIAQEEYERCAKLRDQIKAVQASLASKKAPKTEQAPKADLVTDLEAQLASAIKAGNYALCIPLRDQIKHLKCSCGAVFAEDTCSQCGAERPALSPPGSVSPRESGPSDDDQDKSRRARPPALQKLSTSPAEFQKPPERPEGPKPPSLPLEHKVQPLPPRAQSPPPRNPPGPLSPTSVRPRPPLLTQQTLPNMLPQPPRAPPPHPQLDHSLQECEDQLWGLLGTLDADCNYAIARRYFADRGRGAFFIMFRDRRALFEATKATFQYQTQQGLTTLGVYGTDMAAALSTYDPQTQFIGCVLLKQLEGQPLLLCQQFGESATPQHPNAQGRGAVEAKLERRLLQRPTPEQIQKSTIRPSAEEAKKTEELKKSIWNTLTGFFRWRPKVVELEKLNILSTPACFGGNLAQVYAKANLGDGVLVPNIVRKLIGQIRKEDIAQLVGIFRINGNPSLMAELKRKFDFPEQSAVTGPLECVYCSTVFPSPTELKAHSKDHDGEVFIPGPCVAKADPHTLAGLLKMFLRELAEPLFPCEMYLTIHEAVAANTLDKIPSILSKLPPVNAATWSMTLDFLVEISYHQKTNMMPPRNIAIVMAPNILRLPPKLDTIARFAKDTPNNVAVIEFLIERRAKELNMVPKGVPPPKPVISANAAKNLMETLPPLLPPAAVPMAEVQAPSAAPLGPPFGTPTGPLSTGTGPAFGGSDGPSFGSRPSPSGPSFGGPSPLGPSFGGPAFPSARPAPLPLPGLSGGPPSRPMHERAASAHDALNPVPPARPPLGVAKLPVGLPKPKVEGAESLDSVAELQPRRLPGMVALPKSLSSSNIGGGKVNPTPFKPTSPRPPPNPKPASGDAEGSSEAGAKLAVRPPIPPPR